MTNVCNAVSDSYVQEVIEAQNTPELPTDHLLCADGQQASNEPCIEGNAQDQALANTTDSSVQAEVLTSDALVSAAQQVAEPKQKTVRKTGAQSEIWEDSTGLVRVSTHVNGTFDVLYKTPQVSVPVWDHMILAVLHGVIMALSNDGSKPESICRYKDPADTSRAATFMVAALREFPEFAYEKVADLGDGLARVLGDTYAAMSTDRKNQLATTIQSILVSGSVLKNEIDQASGLVTVAAQFDDKVLKVRLTGKIPAGIAGTLRVPYDVVTERTKQTFYRERTNNAPRDKVGRLENKKPWELGVKAAGQENENKGVKEELEQLMGELNQVQQRVNSLITRNNVNKEKIEKVKAERKPRFQDGKFDTSGDKFTNADERAGDTRTPSSKAKGNRGEKLARGMTTSAYHMDDHAFQSSDASTVVAFDAHVKKAVVEHVQNGDVHAALGDNLRQKNNKPKSYKVGDDLKSAFADKLKSALQSK
jgi:hypothetical protein